MCMRLPAASPVRPVGRQRLRVILAAAVVLLSLNSTQAATLRVRAGESIQGAIERAAPGDTIEIERARYVENLLIAKPLTLRGLQRPTISGDLKGDTIRITGEDVTLDGLIVTDSGDSLRDQNAGIYLFPARTVPWCGTAISPTTCSGCGSKRLTMSASRTT
jgi:nitrous oxidase accessory protein